MARAVTKKETVIEQEEKVVETPKPATKGDVDEYEEYVTYTHPKDFRVRGDDTFTTSINGEEIKVTPGKPQQMKRKFMLQLQRIYATKVKMEENFK